MTKTARNIVVALAVALLLSCLLFFCLYHRQIAELKASTVDRADIGYKLPYAMTDGLTVFGFLGHICYLALLFRSVYVVLLKTRSGAVSFTLRLILALSCLAALLIPVAALIFTDLIILHLFVVLFFPLPLVAELIISVCEGRSRKRLTLT